MTTTVPSLATRAYPTSPRKLLVPQRTQPSPSAHREVTIEVMEAVEQVVTTDGEQRTTPCPAADEDMEVAIPSNVIAVDSESAGSSSRASTPSKILLTISEDLCYTLEISGHTMGAVMTAISLDEQLKQEWHLWNRFIQEPHLFYTYVWDTDFQQYVRHRPAVPIRHLSRIKIKNRFYVSQSHREIDDVLDTEPTDALITTDVVKTDAVTASTTTSSLMVTNDSQNQSSDTVCNNNSKDNNNNNTSNHHNSSLYTSQNHHNYHIISSPSAPISTITSAPIRPISSCLAAAVAHKSAAVQPVLSAPKLGQTLATKAAKKLFTSPSSPLSPPNGRVATAGGLDMDLLADAPTGPSYDWTEEQTVAYLKSCKPYAEELAKKSNVFEVKSEVWEQLAKELNAKDFEHQFDALQCRNHFSRLRSTYMNILCYPALALDTSWPYFALVKDVIGDRLPALPPLTPVAKRSTPVAVATTTPKSARIEAIIHKTRAQTGAKLPVRLTVTQKLAKGVLTASAPVRLTKSERLQALARGVGVKRPPHRKPSGSLMKNGANQEVSELYVALLNLVKKYMKYFEIEKKNKIWNRIEREMNGAGYKWNAVSLRALFHRLRYTYLNILSTVPNEDEARAQWPYFRYLHGMDLTAFSHKKHIQDDSAGTPSAAPIATNTGPKRRPGRPRKQPVLTAIANDTDSQYSSAGTANVDDVDGQGLRGRSNGSVREYSDGAEGTGSDDEDESDEGMVGDEDEEELEVRENTGAAADKKHIKCE